MNGFVLFACILMNLSGLSILIYSWKKINSGKVKNTFIFFIITSLIWVNLVYSTRLVSWNEGELVMISRAIFSLIALTIATYGYFIMEFLQSESLYRKPILIGFMALGVFFVGASLAGYVENGIRMTENGPAPIYNSLHPFIILYYFSFGVYSFYLIIDSYRNTSDLMLRTQMKILLISSIATFIVAGFVNGILPYLVGDSRFSYLGPFAFLILFTGIMKILIHEGKILITSELENIFKLPILGRRENIFSLRELFVNLGVILEKNPSRFQKSVNFQMEDGKNLGVCLTNSNPGDLVVEGDLDLKGPIPTGWIQGIYDAALKLKEDNRRLVFALVNAESKLKGQELERTILSQEEPTLVPVRKLYKISDYLMEIEENEKSNQETYGQSLLCFSVQYKKLLTKIMNVAPSKQLTVFSGESGTGKASLVKAMHHLRNGGQMFTYSCQSETSDSLRNKINEFINLPSGEGKHPGILIKHLDFLDPTQSTMIQPLLNGKTTGKYVYFTCGYDFISGHPPIPDNILYGLRQIVVDILPLRFRTEDIMYQTLYFAYKFSKDYNRPFHGIDKKNMDRILSYSFPGNTAELKNSLHRAIMENPSGYLDNIQFLEPITGEGETEKLSPLDLAEKKVILQILNKHRFNKNRTRKELDITINTLNAKMQKYKIRMPKSSEFDLMTGDEV